MLLFAGFKRELRPFRASFPGSLVSVLDKVLGIPFDGW